MTRINRNNYEVFFVDYLDKTLDPETLVEVETFLKENPDLENELAGLNSVSIPEELRSCPDKQLLYKSNYDEKESFQNACVASIEGDLSSVEKNHFEQFLRQHPELNNEVLLFSKTKLEPDRSIVFGNKNLLYHHSIRTITWYKIAAVAATLTAIVAIAGLVGPSGHMRSVAGLKINTTSEKQITGSPIANRQTAQDYQAKNQSFEPSASQGENQTDVTGAQRTTRTQNIQPRNQSVITSLTGHLIQNVQNKTNLLSLNQSGREEHHPVSFKSIKSNPEIASLTSLKLTSNTFETKSLSTDMIPVYEDQDEITARESAIMAQNDALSFQSQPNSNNHPSVFRLGMNILSGLTGKALHYKTDDDGRVTHIAFDSKFVAFNIPVNGVK